MANNEPIKQAYRLDKLREHQKFLMEQGYVTCACDVAYAITVIEYLSKANQSKPNEQPTDLLPLLRECLEIADSNWTWINREPPATRCQEDVDDAKQHYEKLKAAIERLERDG